MQIDHPVEPFTRQPKCQPHNAPQRSFSTFRVHPDEGHVFRPMDEERCEEGLRQHRERVLGVGARDGINDGDGHGYVADGRKSDDECFCHTSRLG